MNLTETCHLFVHSAQSNATPVEWCEDGREWVDGDIRLANLHALLADGPPTATAVTAPHVQALRADLRAETLSHAAGLTAHTAILLYGSSKFLGRDEMGHSRTTVGLMRARGTTVLAGPPDPWPHRHGSNRVCLPLHGAQCRLAPRGCSSAA